MYKGRVLESLGKKMEKFLGLCYFLYLSKHSTEPVTGGHEEVGGAQQLIKCTYASVAPLSVQYMRRFSSCHCSVAFNMNAKYF